MLQNEKTINYLIVGNGSIANRHVKIIRKFDIKSKIYIYVQSKKKSHKDYKNTSYISLLSEDICQKIDYFYICSPASSHKLYLLKFLKYKKSKIFLEKPLHTSSLTTKDIKSIIPYQKRIYIGYNMRFMNTIKYLKNLVLSKDIFLIKIDTSNNLKYWRKSNYKKSVTAIKSKGGGIILELSHEIDYLYSIFKSLKIKYSFNSKLSNLNINVEDFLHVHLLNKKKTNIILNMNMFSSLPERTIKVFCNDKVYLFDLIKNKISIYSKHYKLIKILNFKNDLNDSYIRQFKNMRYRQFNEFERCSVNEANNILNIVGNFR